MDWFNEFVRGGSYQRDRIIIVAVQNIQGRDEKKIFIFQKNSIWHFTARFFFPFIKGAHRNEAPVIVKCNAPEFFFKNNGNPLSG